MPYNAQNLRENISQIEGDIALELELSEGLPPISSERAIAFAVGAVKRDLDDHITWLSKQVVPSAESDIETIVKAAAYEGVPRKLATKAKGPVTIPAADGSALPVDTVLQHKNGQRYLVTRAELHAEGSIAFEVNAETAGAAANLKAGETLSLVSPIAGLEGNATVAGTGITGGADIEPISELLGRLYFRKQNPPMGGAVHDYMAWATEVPGVTRAWAYDAYHGGGTIGLTFVCDGFDPIIPNDAKVQEVDSYIYRHEDPATGNEVGRPGGIELVPFKLRLKTVQLNIRLTPDNAETRKAVKDNLDALERAQVTPGGTLLLSNIRTAIGMATGVMDYQLTLGSNITSEQDELITFGEPQWQAQ